MAHPDYASSVATNPREVGPFTRMFAKEVKNQRTDAEFTQEQLSKRAAIGLSTLSKIERGVVAIDMEQMDRLAAAFNMTPEEFIASARRHAKERDERERRRDADYLPGGTLDPEAVRGAAESDEHLDRAVARRKERSATRRTSTPVT